MAELLEADGLKASADLAKQIITLSTGAVAFTITFLEKFTKTTNGTISHAPNALYVAWCLFAVTIGAALWTLMAITGTLDALDRKANGWTMTADQTTAATGGTRNVRIPASVMILSFLFAVVAMIWTGFSL